ncbi:unnamed protein product, partial [Prorocentrum cordatum]
RPLGLELQRGSRFPRKPHPAASVEAMSACRVAPIAGPPRLARSATSATGAASGMFERFPCDDPLAPSATRAWRGVNFRRGHGVNAVRARDNSSGRGVAMLAEDPSRWKQNVKLPRMDASGRRHSEAIAQSRAAFAKVKRRPVTGVGKMAKRRYRALAKLCEIMQSEEASDDFEDKLRAQGGDLADIQGNPGIRVELGDGELHIGGERAERVTEAPVEGGEREPALGRSGSRPRRSPSARSPSSSVEPAPVDRSNKEPGIPRRGAPPPRGGPQARRGVA